MKKEYKEFIRNYWLIAIAVGFYVFTWLIVFHKIHLPN